MGISLPTSRIVKSTLRFRSLLTSKGPNALSYWTAFGRRLPYSKRRTSSPRMRKCRNSFLGTSKRPTSKTSKPLIDSYISIHSDPKIRIRLHLRTVQPLQENRPRSFASPASNVRNLLPNHRQALHKRAHP